jgi:hypothetical protein
LETFLGTLTTVGVAVGLGLMPWTIQADDPPAPVTPGGASDNRSSAGPAIVNTGADLAAPNATAAVTTAHESFWSGWHAEDFLKFDWGKWQVKPKFSAVSLYTDNFQYRESSLAESDNLLIFSPGFDVQYGSTEYNHATFGYSHDQVIYVSHSNYNTSQDHLNLGLNFTHNRWNLTGTDQIDFLSSFIGIANTQRTILINRRPWKDGYTLTFDATERLRPYVVAYHNSIEYDPSSGFYSTELFKGSAGTSYILTSRVKLFGDLYYGQESPSKTSELQPPVYYNVFYGGGFGATGQFTTRLSGTVRFGYELRSVPHNPAIKDTGSPVVALDLTYLPTQYSEILLTASRSTSVSATTPTTSVESKVKLSAIQYISTDLKWALQFDASASLIDFTDRTITGLLIPFPIQTPSGPGTVSIFSSARIGRSDTDYTLGLSLNYIPNRWLRASLGFSHEEYSLSYNDRKYAYYVGSNLNGLQPYQVNSVTLQVSIGF